MATIFAHNNKKFGAYIAKINNLEQSNFVYYEQKKNKNASYFFVLHLNGIFFFNGTHVLLRSTDFDKN
jgi:hypothetical protein